MIKRPEIGFKPGLKIESQGAAEERRQRGNYFEGTPEVSCSCIHEIKFLDPDFIDQTQEEIDFLMSLLEESK